MNMAEYEKHRCQKCGAYRYVIGGGYDSLFRTRYDKQRDVLVITCHRCGFEYDQSPIDAAQEAGLAR